jgi:hypothetical protein
MTIVSLPPDFSTSRLGLHRVAAYLVSPARRQVTGRIGLRATPGGFGTPLFLGNQWVRVVGTDVVVEIEGDRSVVPITSLNQIGEAMGLAPDVAWASQFDIPDPGELDADLGVAEPGAAALAGWYAFAWSIFEELRDDEASIDASEPQLWPEHFDPAIETGSDALKQRASYGFSPGDAAHDEPYLYVGPWYADNRPDSDYWNATSFPGSALTYGKLLEADDPRAVALAFLRQGREILAGA